VKSNFLYGDYLLEVLQVESQTGLIERPDLAYPPIDLTVDLDVSLQALDTLEDIFSLILTIVLELFLERNFNKVAEICYIMFELDPFLLNSILLADLED
jgi:hypothetical protein